MKHAMILSKDNRSIEILRSAASASGLGELEAFENDHRLLERLHEMRATPPAIVFVDLDGFDDGARLVEWLRFSPPTRRLKVVIVGVESAPLDRFRKAWGSEAVARKPLNQETVCDVLKKLGETASAKHRTSRQADRRRLIEAIAEAKRLHAERQRLAGEANTLVAEIKDRKLPFKRARVTAPTEAIHLCQRSVLYVAENAAHRHFFSTAMSQAAATFSVQFLRRFTDVIEHLREKGENRRITSDSPCCLLMDASAGDESMSDVLRWVRSQSAFPELLLVVLSERDNPETIGAVYRAGADYYLVKPKSFEGLIAIVNVIEAGLGQVPPRFHSFLRLAEYRDAMGNAVIRDEADAKAAE